MRRVPAQESLRSSIFIVHAGFKAIPGTEEENDYVTRDCEIDGSISTPAASDHAAWATLRLSTPLTFLHVLARQQDWVTSEVTEDSGLLVMGAYGPLAYSPFSAWQYD